MNNPKHLSLKSLINCALCCTLTCVLAIIIIPIGPVPITLANLAIYFSVGLLKPSFAFLSQIIYICLITVGLPFAGGFKGGLGVILGPTGGFIIGYSFMALIAGLIYNFCKRNSKLNTFLEYVNFIIACEIGTFVCYLFGLFWFMYLLKTNFIKAFAVCVLPFLLGDFIKICVAGFIVFRIKKFLN